MVPDDLIDFSLLQSWLCLQTTDRLSTFPLPTWILMDSDTSDYDVDGDGLANWMDTDDDQDGVADWIDLDANGDGAIDSGDLP